MAINRAKKEDLLALYKEQIAKSTAIVVASYQGMTVKELEELRGKVREAEGRFFVVKNKIARIALAEANLPKIDDLLVGTTGIGFCWDNPPGVSKALLDYAKGNDKFVIKGGLLGPQILDEKTVSQLVTLPTIDDMRAKIVGLLNAPASDLVRVTDNSVSQLAKVLSAAGGRQLVNVFNAYAQKSSE